MNEIFLILISLSFISAFKHCVVTNNPNHLYLKYLSTSANNQVTIIDTHTKQWKNNMKLTYYLEYLKTLPPKEVVLLTDGFDVILIDSHEKILTNFLKFSVDILVSAESGKWPHHVKEYGNKSLTFPYLNSGAIIGYADAIIRTISRGYDKKEDDQYSWTLWYLNPTNETTMVLDHQNEIFISMWKVKSTDIQENPFKHLQTTGYPQVVHFNGDKSGYLSYVEKYVKLP